MEYVFQNKRIIAKILSFFRFIKFSQEIGIPQNEIHNALHMYTKLCLPEKLGMITLATLCSAIILTLLWTHLIWKKRKKISSTNSNLSKDYPATPSHTQPHLATPSHTQPKFSQPFTTS